ncbi:hypothetical protein [Sphingomonas aurantiaca]|uniref:hypothetical protein n=1 Tax=Sphingomonas aurantiaca TaxID=185949 RepID=UPI002FE1B42F
MIGYATLGTNDIDAALTFYDALLATAGGKRLMQMPDDRKLTFYGAGAAKPMLVIGKPYDGQAATAGNGTMVALAADLARAGRPGPCQGDRTRRCGRRRPRHARPRRDGLLRRLFPRSRRQQAVHLQDGVSGVPG